MSWWVGLVAIVAAKFFLAIFLPLTGDEAYFALWGRHFDFGYYDHPPFAGWWLWLVLQFSDGSLAIRFAAVVVSLLPAYIVYLEFQKSSAIWKPGVFIAVLVPVFAINVFYTTDTWLFAFTILALWCYVRGWERRRQIWFFLAGLCLALAFLSKYLVAVIALSIAFHLLIFGSGRRWSMLWLVAPGIPAMALNLYWNLEHCGYNFLFYLVNRLEDGGLHIMGPLLVLVMVLYALTPWIVWQWYRDRLYQITHPWMALTGISLAIWMALSLVVPIGLHWLLPTVFLGVMSYLKGCESSLTDVNVRGITAFGALHLLTLLSFAIHPVERLIDRDLADRVEHYRFIDQFIQPLESRLAEGWLVASPSYSRAAVLGQALNSDVLVFGAGSRYGRQMDILTDWESRDGQSILVVGRGKRELESFVPFFHSVSWFEIPLMESSVQVLAGQGFQFDLYRATVLQKTITQFYQIPNGWPVMECEFISRYRHSD